MAVGELLCGPLTQSRIPSSRVGIVVDGLHVRSIRCANQKWTNTLVGGQTARAFAADSHEGAQVAAILAPGVVAVVVGDGSALIERLDQREVQAPAACLARPRAALAHAVEEVPHDLVGHEQLEQTGTASPGDDPE